MSREKSRVAYLKSIPVVLVFGSNGRILLPVVLHVDNELLFLVHCCHTNDVLKMTVECESHLFLVLLYVRI